MAIRTEKTGSEELLLDSRYHLATLLSDPETESMAPAVKKVDSDLRAARSEAEIKEGIRVEKQALLDRSDLLLDQRLRKVDLELLAIVDGKRDHESYRQVFPRGASTIISMVGAEESVAVLAVCKALQQSQPDLYKRHGADLKKLGTQASEAEAALLAADADADRAFTAEIAARRALVRQLQKNEGALLAIYPGQRSVVRSFFRPQPRRAADSEPTPTPPATP